MTTDTRSDAPRAVLMEVAARVNANVEIDAQDADPLVTLAAIEQVLASVRSELVEDPAREVPPMLLADPLTELAALCCVWAARLVAGLEPTYSNAARHAMGLSVETPATPTIEEDARLQRIQDGMPVEPLAELGADALDIALGAIEGARERSTPGTSRYEGLTQAREALAATLANRTIAQEQREAEAHSRLVE